MKKVFQNRLDGINWIAEYARTEGEFEILREQLIFNYIYFESYFLEIDPEEEIPEIVFKNISLK